jgi:hypothetical protein
MTDEKRALVATPAGRDRAIALLQDHYARNHLEVAEYERRVELAERATSDAALNALLSDLPAIATEVAPEARGRVTSTIGALLGATSRRGRWRVPSLVRVRAVMGSVELDLSDAEIASGETVIEVTAILGNVVVTVPEGLSVDMEGSAILGSFDQLVMGAASRRDTRRVRIIGRARLGSVDVIVKKKTGLLEDIKSTVRGLLGG